MGPGIRGLGSQSWYQLCRLGTLIYYTFSEYEAKQLPPRSEVLKK